MIFLAVLMQTEVEPINILDWKSVLLQLGVGIFIAGPFIFLWWDERKQKKSLEAMLIEKLSTLVVDSTSALLSARQGFADTVDKIAEKSSRMDLDKALRRIEVVSDELIELRKDKGRSDV